MEKYRLEIANASIFLHQNSLRRNFFFELFITVRIKLRRWVARSNESKTLVVFILKLDTFERRIPRKVNYGEKIYEYIEWKICLVSLYEQYEGISRPRYNDSVSRSKCGRLNFQCWRPRMEWRVYLCHWMWKSWPD